MASVTGMVLAIRDGLTAHVTDCHDVDHMGIRLCPCTQCSASILEVLHLQRAAHVRSARSDTHPCPCANPHITVGFGLRKMGQDGARWVAKVAQNWVQKSVRARQFRGGAVFERMDRVSTMAQRSETKK